MKPTRVKLELEFDIIDGNFYTSEHSAPLSIMMDLRANRAQTINIHEWAFRKAFATPSVVENASAVLPPEEISRLKELWVKDGGRVRTVRPGLRNEPKKKELSPETLAILSKLKI